MVLSKQLSLSDLIVLCRAMRHNLDAGLTLRDVFRQQSKRGSPAVRPIAERICTAVESGESLEDALKSERSHFPPLFLSLASVGENTGNLPEIFGELERYFILQQRLWRNFMGQIAWPVLQLFAAIFVIAGMILVLGLVAPSGTKPFDPLGLGLSGPSGAMTFLMIAFGTIGGLLALYYLATQVLKQQALVDGILLRVPVLGPTLRALAMMRFCLALRLTLETGMSVASALRLCMRATGNGAFVGQTSTVVEAVKAGEDLTTSLTHTGLFPEEFLHILSVAEEGGRVTEVMRNQADYYQELAARRMTILTMAAGACVWVTVAILIIIVIFRIALTYIGMLDPAKYGL
jgi:type IV pilus assembly protein PilC